MKMIFFRIALLFVASITILHATEPEIHKSYIDDLIYSFNLFPTDADAWNWMENDSPPLLPGKAIKIAETFISKISPPDPWEKWTLTGIHLDQMKSFSGHWLYVAKFKASSTKAMRYAGALPWFDVPILFNGTIPEPTITKRK